MTLETGDTVTENAWMAKINDYLIMINIEMNTAVGVFTSDLWEKPLNKECGGKKENCLAVLF